MELQRALAGGSKEIQYKQGTKDRMWGYSREKAFSGVEFVDACAVSVDEPYISALQALQIGSASLLPQCLPSREENHRCAKTVRYGLHNGV